MRAGHKGLSPLMATILLVAVAIIAFAAIFMWVSIVSVEKVQKFGAPAEDSCAQLSFVPTLSSNYIIINNQGPITIYAIDLRISKDGQTFTRFLRPKDGFIQGGEIDSVSASVEDLTGFVERADVVPVILGQGTQSQATKAYTCEGQAKALI